MLYRNKLFMEVSPIYINKNLFILGVPTNEISSPIILRLTHPCYIMSISLK